MHHDAPKARRDRRAHHIFNLFNYCSPAVLTDLQDRETDKTTQLIIKKAPMVTVKAYHALHAALAHVVAARRRDVLDPRLPVSHQLVLLQRPVSGSDALVEDY